MKLVFPFFSGDAWLLYKNLDWMAELDGKIDRDCVLACDDQTKPNEALAKAKTIFRSVEVCTYPRAYHNGVLMEKWPWQQNNSFANTARYMARQKEPWFWCETDCTPLVPGWWKIMEDEYVKGGKPFGGHWNKDAGTGIFNGVAIYPAQVIKFASKALQSAIEIHPGNRQEPWDVLCSQQVKPHLHIMNHVMQHLWRLPDQDDTQCPTFPDAESVAKWVRQEVVLFHRCKDGTLIDRWREIKNKKIHLDFKGKDIVIPVTPPPPSPKETVDLFCVSHRQDGEWFYHLYKSIKKYATGFNKFVVVVPTVDKPIFEKYFDGDPFVNLQTFFEQPGKGMLHHEAIIMMADQFSQADYIAHIDSDCLFHRSVTPGHYFHKGKPVMLRAKFTDLPKPFQNWQKAVELALGFSPEYETMQRHPAVHPRWLYAEVRKAIEAYTGKPLLEYVLSCREEFPQTFAEFPILGAWALRNKPKTHHWITVGADMVKPPNPLIQFWSKGGLELPIRSDTWGTPPKEFWGKTPRQVTYAALA